MWYKCLLTICFATFLCAQEFEVATLKVSPPAQDLIQINLGTASHGKLTLTNASLSDCLRYAYALVSDEQLQGPDWITSKAIRFDIVGQAAGDTREAELRLMLRKLLAERLGVVVHTEKKQMSYLALTVSRSGPRMAAAPSDLVGNNPARKGNINAQALTIGWLAMLLSRFEQQVVIDETGLEGKYEIHLEWTPEDSREPSEKPSLFTAVQQQLGLKLEPRKGPLGVIVVDHSERNPLAN